MVHQSDFREENTEHYFTNSRNSNPNKMKEGVVDSGLFLRNSGLVPRKSIKTLLKIRLFIRDANHYGIH